MDNVALNQLDNVEILPIAIGKEEYKQRYEFSSKVGYADTWHLDRLKFYIREQIDFIKIDGEGCEWNLEPEQLKGIREIRMEFHIRRGNHNSDNLDFAKWLGWLKSEGYSYTIDYGESPSFCVPFSKCILLNASRREE